MMRARLIALSATALALSAGSTVAQIGTVAAVNQRMDGTPPAASKRQLFLKDPVVTDERVQTTNAGSGQLLFVDQTSLTLAPDSDIILDKYVFDPDQQKGDIALSLTKGAVRFIGGAITKGSEAIIRTPTSTIGIRGGMGIVKHENGKTTVINLASLSITITTYGDKDGDGIDDGPGQNGEEGESKSLALTRPSTFAVSGPGGVTFEGITNVEFLSQLFSLFEGGGLGGLLNAGNAGDARNAARQVAKNNSEQKGGTENDPVSTTGAAQPGDLEDGSGDPNAEGQNEGSIAELIGENIEQISDMSSDGQMMTTPLFQPADPLAIAQLTGTGTFTGPAFAQVTGPNNPNMPLQEMGTANLTYFFGDRTGRFGVNLPSGNFSAQVDALKADASLYFGIFSSNEVDTFTVTGAFLSSPTETAAATSGGFTAEIQTQGVEIVGGYQITPGSSP